MLLNAFPALENYFILELAALRKGGRAFDKLGSLRAIESNNADR
jgi:hypothetical protein